MATATRGPTEADILEQIVAPEQLTMSEALARAIVELRFNQSAVSRMNELAEKNRTGRLTDSEQSELEKYHRVGNYLNLLQAKSRFALA